MWLLPILSHAAMAVWYAALAVWLVGALWLFFAGAWGLAGSICEGGPPVRLGLSLAILLLIATGAAMWPILAVVLWPFPRSFETME